MNTATTRKQGREVEIVTGDGELVTGQLPAGYESSGGNQSLAVNLARAEIDQQITTAHALPRSITRAIQNIMTLATIDEESAEECIYALPRAGKAIKGPSIRLAEIISSQWGNCRVGARVVHVDRYEKFVEAEGVFHDLETNTATASRVRRRISDKKGELLSEDMIVVTGNAACAIAKRNSILGGVPKAVWRKAYAAVEQVIAGDVKTLSERREKAMKAFAAFGATPEQVCAALGVVGLDDIGLEQMSVLTGMHAALKNGEATVEEMFPTPRAIGERPKTLGEALDKLANGNGEPAKEAEATEVKEEPKPAEPAKAAAAPTPEPAKPVATVATAPATAAETETIDESEPDTRPADPRQWAVPDAYHYGEEQRAKGVARKAVVPPEIRENKELSAAVISGWESAAGPAEAEVAGAR